MWDKNFFYINDKIARLSVKIVGPIALNTVWGHLIKEETIVIRIIHKSKTLFPPAYSFTFIG